MALNPVESDGDENYVMRDENPCPLSAKPWWSESLMWCARCHADLAPSRDLIPVFHIIFCVHRSGPNAKSVDSTGLPRHEGSTWTRGLGPIVANRSDPGSWIFPSTTSILSFMHLANTERADSEAYESVRVCSWEIIPSDIWQFTAVKRT